MPLFDHILLERLRNKDDKTIKILSDYLAQIITKTSQSNASELSHSLQHVIGPAISQEIASNKDAMVDTLYPIMGGMISKYVSQAIKEMMENINNKIEDGLSFDKYKRKVKSKITGVSETELLLEESNDALISSLFVIDKESGMLIAEAQLEDQEIDDPHIVASMASAIKDFINDWVQNDTKQSEIQILSYDNATLYIESAGSVYIIAFLDAEPDHEIRTKINTFFASVVKKYAEFFQNFDGDDSTKEIVELSHMMKTYLNAQQAIKKSPSKKSSSGTSSHNPVKYIAIVFGVMILIGLGYYAKGQYFEYQLEKKIKSDTGYSIVIESEDDRLILSGKVEKFSDSKKINSIIKMVSPKPIVNNLHMPISDIEQEIATHQKEFARTLEKKLGTSLKKSQNSIDKTKERVKENERSSKKLDERVIKKLELYDKNLKKLKESFTHSLHEKDMKINNLKQQEYAIAYIAKLQDRIMAKLSIAFSSDMAFNPKEGSLDFSSGDLFETGSSALNEDIKMMVENNFEVFIKQLLQDKEIKKYIKTIVIEGHTDSTGNPLVNRQLSQKRAEKVMEYLLTLEVASDFHLKSLLSPQGLGSMQPILRDSTEDKRASRRIKIKFLLDKHKMIQEIGKIVI